MFFPTTAFGGGSIFQTVRYERCKGMNFVVGGDVLDVGSNSDEAAGTGGGGGG